MKFIKCSEISQNIDDPVLIPLNKITKIYDWECGRRRVSFTTDDGREYVCCYSGRYGNGSFFDSIIEI